MPISMKAYLDELVKAGAVSDEDRKVLEKYFKDDNAGLVKYLEENQLRQSDYSRLTDSMKAEKTQLESEKANILKLQQQLSTKEGGWTQEKQRIADDLVKARTRLSTAMEKLKEKYDVEDEQLKDIFGDEPAPTKQEAKMADTTPDLSRFIDKETAMSSFKSVVEYNNWLWDTQQEHHRLFGSYFSPKEILSEIEKDPKLTPQQVWESKYKVQDKIKELQDKDIETRAAARAEELYQQKMASFSGSSLEGSMKPDAESFSNSHEFLKEKENEEVADYGASPLTGDLAKSSLAEWDKHDSA